MESRWIEVLSLAARDDDESGINLGTGFLQAMLRCGGMSSIGYVQDGSGAVEQSAVNRIDLICVQDSLASVSKREGCRHGDEGEPKAIHDVLHPSRPGLAQQKFLHLTRLTSEQTHVQRRSAYRGHV